MIYSLEFLGSMICAILQTACLLWGMLFENSSRKSSIADESLSGRIKAKPLSCVGQMAPNMFVEMNCFCRTTLGRVPFGAQILVVLPC